MDPRKGLLLLASWHVQRIILEIPSWLPRNQPWACSSSPLAWRSWLYAAAERGHAEEPLAQHPPSCRSSWSPGPVFFHQHYVLLCCCDLQWLLSNNRCCGTVSCSCVSWIGFACFLAKGREPNANVITPSEFQFHSNINEWGTFGPMAFFMALTALRIPRRKISGSWVEYLKKWGDENTEISPSRTLLWLQSIPRPPKGTR